MIGQVFNKWTVIGKAEKNKSGHRLYLCRCECGTEKKQQLYNIKFGASKQCNPCARDIIRKRGIVKSGTIFGKRTIMGYMGKDKRSNRVYLVRCDCGRQDVARLYYLKKGKATRCQECGIKERRNRR